MEILENIGTENHQLNQNFYNYILANRYRD